MKNKALLACLVASICSINSAFAEDSKDAWIDFMKGTWTWTTQNGGVGELTFSREENAPVLIGRGKAGDATWVLVWGRHRDTGDIVEHTYGSDGSHSMTKFSVDDKGDLVGAHEGWSPMGKLKSTKRLTKSDDDSFTFYVTGSVVGDDKQEDIELPVKRK